MAYTEVAVNSPLAQRRTFSYAIPPGLNITTGQAVWIPFGDKLLQGIIMELADRPAVVETREISGLIEPQPLLSPDKIALARWISGHYLSPLFAAVALMLPPGFERKSLTFVSATPAVDNCDTSLLTPEQRQVLELIGSGRVGLKQLEKRLGKKKAQATVAQLVRRGLAARSYELEPVRIHPKQELFLRLEITADQAAGEKAHLQARRAGKQARLLEFLARQPRPVPWTEARRQTGTDRATANALVSRGIISAHNIEAKRKPMTSQSGISSPPPVLTPDQQTALKAIKPGLSTLQKGKPPVFLLHGVTGSGKTEIYLRSLAETVRLGKRGIVLVPEISLTPQTIERFAARFPGRVAVLHSRLTPGEQFDEWRRIRDGECDVVIGPRSALFAPQPDLGLIVIDEEHEWSYKQDTVPHYHARDAAIKLADLAGATVILGSATPDVESYHHAQAGDYHLLNLPQRVVPNTSLPAVEIVDMRAELRAGNRSLFSRSLSAAIAATLANGEQVILFLNRRGAATLVQCRACGFVFRCKRCAVALSHHPAADSLVCHQCNYRMPVPQSCPQCGSRRMKFLGLGTQKLEQETDFTFPQARLLRWDSDIARGRHSHEQILERFRKHQADILIGTQMLAKGLDLPLVTLVGVVSADTALNLPDFRAGERTFQLLSQVAGRAGRGARGGRVVVQTYSPEHYAIQAAARHDYNAVYTREMEYRRLLQNPPFNRLASLVYHSTNDAACQREAGRMKRLLASEIAASGSADLTVIGPAPAFIHRRRGRYRWQLVLRGAEPAHLLSEMPIPLGWTVDIDPVGLT